ncbi:MAG TPA: hypothetical protein VLT85_02490 [Terriglobales bacterium]|nr:hypothetical protein [Terriglobales bacterium]
MMEAYLVPERTRVTAKGDGAAVDLSAAKGRIFLATLAITDIIEQESLDVSLWGSADGQNWGQKSLAAFPQLFYRGEAPLLADLTAHPEIKFLRAHWEVARWGRGEPTPMFVFQVTLKEVPPEVMKEVATAAAARR